MSTSGTVTCHCGARLALNDVDAHAAACPVAAFWANDSRKQRLERISTAVLAGMMPQVAREGFKYENAAIVAVAQARALIAELDKEPDHA